jgi:deoxyribodipyrimidine photo-lyase
MQKLEDDPTLENNALCRALNELRPRNPDPALFVAWCKGETGFPMVDACMKSLHATGWLTFRMRAMLVSFACYQLWCDWRPVARYLATQFLDYEPGIHYPQVQMQAGVTGINALRIYSPSKQVADHDPEGEFIKAYLPALAGVPSGYLAQPHTMPPLLQAMVGCVIGQDYPAPIVDPASAYHTAKQLAFEAKRSPQVRAEAQQVYQKHGSRQGQRRRSKLTS